TGDTISHHISRQCKATYQPPTPADNPDGGGGSPKGQEEIRDRLRDERAHPDHRKAADDQIVADDAASSDGRPRLYQRGQGVLVGLRPPQLLQVRGGGPWAASVCE